MNALDAFAAAFSESVQAVSCLHKPGTHLEKSLGGKTKATPHSYTLTLYDTPFRKIR